MQKLTVRLAVAATLLFAASILATAPATVHAQSCGIQPLKPLTPLGCRDLRAECACETTPTGMKCGYKWICEK